MKSKGGDGGQARILGVHEGFLVGWTGERGPTTDRDKLEQLRRDNPSEAYNQNWDPRRLWLTGYQESDRVVKFSGFARDGEDVSEFERRLRLSDFFDEASSSLDAPTERLVQRALQTVLADRTALIIAHRLSTVGIADRVMVMADGHIVEDGDPDTLLAEGTGEYATLARAWRESLV